MPLIWNTDQSFEKQNKKCPEESKLMEVFKKIKQQHGVSRKDFLGKNMGVGCHFPLQGTFPTQGLNPHLLYHLHWQADSLQPSHQGSPSRKEENVKLIYAESQSTPMIWNPSLIGPL